MGVEKCPFSMNWHALFEQTAGENDSLAIVNDLIQYLCYVYAAKTEI